MGSGVRQNRSKGGLYHIGPEGGKKKGNHASPSKKGRREETNRKKNPDKATRSDVSPLTKRVVEALVAGTNRNMGVAKTRDKTLRHRGRYGLRLRFRRAYAETGYVDLKEGGGCKRVQKRIAVKSMAKMNGVEGKKATESTPYL